jgi:hypothetical protein
MRGTFRWILQPMMRAWGFGLLRGLSSVPRPAGHPQAHASGVDADRILLFGTGASVGWGVLTHDLALPGMLARALTALTGRGTDVDVLSAPEFSAATAISELSAVHLWRYDAVVVTLGLNETLQFGSLASWRHDFDELLDQLADGISRGSRVYVLGVHSVTKVTLADALAFPFAQRHRKALNGVTAQLSAERNRAAFVPFDVVRTRERNHYRTAGDYREGARILSSLIAPALDRGFALGASGSRDARASGTDEAARQRAVNALGIVDTAPEERLDQMVAFARRAFGTASAALTIIDNDRQWHKSRVGVTEDEIPRAFSICATTIQQAGALVVSDASLDERFKDVPRIEGMPPVRFYAGFPVESPTGERIGALCVFDPAARDTSEVDRVLLRELALVVQKELWQRASV